MNSVYTKLSAMFFLEYAVWGAWMPVLAPRLLGTLKMSGKQTGWIFATLPLACIVAPILAGLLAPTDAAAQWFLAGAHLLGAVLLVLAAWQRRFWPLFIVMFLYSLLYAGTMPLATIVVLNHATDANAGIIGRIIEWIVRSTSTKPVADVSAGAGAVFLWAAIGWALVGYFLTGWRWIFKTEKEGTDAFYLAAVLSIGMGLLCLVLPSAPADASSGQGFMELVKDLVHWIGGNSNFCIFLGVSLFVAGTMQFYFIGTGPFMTDIGVRSRSISGSMAMAQAAQAIATLVLLDNLYKYQIGPKWTLVAGAGSWLALYLIYTVARAKGAIIGAQPLHGIAYVLFIMGGWMFAGDVAPKNIGAAIQGVVQSATVGIGAFLGTQAVGVAMDRFKAGDKFQWGKIWALPALITLAGIIVLVVAFTGPLTTK